ncbi:anti-sigma factor family protein [Brevibacillus borstelensis]|uniref:anti-sigma factor family protein n=1 Tax=Brevibacillus borstelensis TaxID=45462 RepID=UPI0030C1E802
MPHIDEFTLMMYSDGELSEEEADSVQKHVSGCHHCGSSLERMMAEKRLVADRFFSDDLPPLSFELYEMTSAQIHGIAMLHKRNRRRFLWRMILLCGSILAVAACYMMFWQRIWLEWVSPAWTSWKSHLFWSSALWLNGSAREFFHVPGSYVMALPLPFFLLIGLLFILNIRFSPLPPSRLSKREVD